MFFSRKAGNVNIAICVLDLLVCDARHPGPFLVAGCTCCGWYVSVVVGTTYLILGVAITAWTFLGRWVVLMVFRRHGQDEPKGIDPDSTLELAGAGVWASVVGRTLGLYCVESGERWPNQACMRGAV